MKHACINRSLYSPLAFYVTGLIMMLFFNAELPAQAIKKPENIFAKTNLVAWCIVPFDNKNRNAEERAAMLQKLGITRFAYDWREKHIPQFDAELDALQQHGIQLQAFWYASGPEPEKDKNLQLILNVLKKHQVKTQLWCMIGGDKMLENLNQEERVRTVAKAVGYIAVKAAEIGCTVGLYNHGGWFGEPENQLAIINYLKLPNIGMVFNFSHAEYQAQRFADFFPIILPHLYAINITGLKKGYPAEVVPVGQGDMELTMMRIIKEKGYKGPVGIINENFAPDAEDGLRLNIEGMIKLLQTMNDREALKTYGK